MCLAVPMRVIDVEGLVARCEAKGIARTVSLLLLQHEDVAPGDFVTVHMGSATGKISAEQAAAAWALYDEMLGLDAGRGLDAG